MQHHRTLKNALGRAGGRVLGNADATQANTVSLLKLRQKATLEFAVEITRPVLNVSCERCAALHMS